jgi:hypothetical protein
VSGFARNNSSSAWSTAWLGLYSLGLGVTDAGEGDGSNNQHVVDNIGGYHDYVLFEFSAPIVVNQAFLDYIYAGHSDISVWIGTKTNPFANHNTLSDAFLTSLGTREDNNTTSTASSRFAVINAANRVGNVVVIAASTSTTTPDDGFKLHKLLFCQGGTATPTPTPTPTATATATATATPRTTPTPTPTCVPGTFIFEGNSALSGTAGNIRTFTVNGVTVNVSAFSRADSNGAWSTSWLGVYSLGLGVTGPSEGDGSNNQHVVDNIGGSRDYVLFEFSAPVVVDQAFLDYVYNGDSDMSAWIGTKTNPISNHNTLSDAFLTSLGTREDNDTTLTTSRFADINAANTAGNVLVIAASASDTTPEDTFKLHKLLFCR